MRRPSLLAALTAALVVAGLWGTAGLGVSAAGRTGAPALNDLAARPAKTAQAGPAHIAARRAAPGTAANRYLGRSRSPHVWHSGGWPGGVQSAARSTRWGTWRGSASDAALAFPTDRTWNQLKHSHWVMDAYKGFRGTLVYSLPILPRSAKPAELKDVAAGLRDDVYRQVARDLRVRGRGRSVVRVGWEPNGNWMAYSVTATTAADYRAAFRRIATVMKKESPGLVIDFDVNCGTALKGQTRRLDSLTLLYPGDDVVDLVGCDVYDWWVLGAKSEAQWRRAIRPAAGVGIADVADFARARGKGLSFPEWGLAGKHTGGNGDNPFYIAKMRQFFVANSDILVLENYFNVPEKRMRNSLWKESPQLPKAGALYRRLW